MAYLNALNILHNYNKCGARTHGSVIKYTPCGPTETFTKFVSAAPAPVKASKGQHQKPLYNAICQQNHLNCVINSSEHR